MFNVSDRHLRLGYVLSFCLIISIGSTCLAENLLVNGNFERGKPSDKDFGWKLELAKGPKNKCTVVEGREPGTKAIRVYNDELGASFISQEIVVRPWRWYVAEIWVKSDGMYALGFAPSFSLRGGGRDSSGSKFHDDAFGWPKSGWRMIRVYNNSQDSERLTLRLGGGGIADGWSGELLFGELVVRECSLVEAASYYPYPTDRHPKMYGPQLDAKKGQYGYAIQNDDVCRVAPNFPNPLYIRGRMDRKAPEGRVSLVLPPGVRFRRFHYKNTTPKITDLPDGKQHLELPPGSCDMLLDADLAVEQFLVEPLIKKAEEVE